MAGAAQADLAGAGAAIGLDDLLTSEQVAAWLQVTTDNLRVMRCRKQIPFLRLGGKDGAQGRTIRYSRAELTAWLKTRIAGAKP